MRKKITVNPFKGVVKSDVLKENIRKACNGDTNAKSYCRGALAYLERKPPNPFVVKVLKKALERK